MKEFKPTKNSKIYYIVDKDGNILERSSYRGTKKFFTSLSAAKNSVTFDNGGKKFDWNKFTKEGFIIGEFNLGSFEKTPVWFQVAVLEVLAGGDIAKILKQYGYTIQSSRDVSILDLEKRVTKLEHATNIFGDS